MLLRAEPAGEAAGAQGEFVFVNDCMGGPRKPGMQIIDGDTDVAQAEQQCRKRLLEMKVDAEYFSSEFEEAGLSAADHETLQGRIVENLTEVGAPRRLRRGGRSWPRNCQRGRRGVRPRGRAAAARPR